MTENPTPDDCRRMSTRLAHAFNKGPKSNAPQEVGEAIEILAWAGAKIERLEAEVRQWKYVEDPECPDGPVAERCEPGCNLHYVRPGKTQCDCNLD